IGVREHYVDGGIRDGYPISVAAKIGGVTQIIGVNLGYAGMRRQDILMKAPFAILSQSLDIMMMDHVIGDLNDRDLRRSQIITVNPLIYDIDTFELEYIPQMIDRGYKVMQRFCAEKGLTIH